MSKVRETLELLAVLVGVVSGLSEWRRRCLDTKSFLVICLALVSLIILVRLIDNRPRDR